MTIAVELCGRIGPDFTLDVAFEAPAGGVTALLGPSGSGKTSILRALAGLDRVPGKVRVGEEIWQNSATFVPAHRRRVGYIFQGIGLLPHLTVRGNLDYARRRAPDGPFLLDDIVVRTGISPLLDRMPARLSGGETQRASIARALLTQPRLLLMDEPLSALDGEARSMLVDHLEALLTDIAIPVFYVTHDEAEAARLCSRSIRLRGGKLERIDGVRDR